MKSERPTYTKWASKRAQISHCLPSSFQDYARINMGKCFGGFNRNIHHFNKSTRMLLSLSAIHERDKHQNIINISKQSES
jgi:hypothetical protein